MRHSIFRARPCAGLVLSLALSLSLGAAPALAGVAQDRIFATGVLDEIATGAQIGYAREREVGIVHDRLTPFTDGRVELSIVLDDEARREARLSMTEDAGVRRFNPFPADAGNPLLMVFMETAVHGMAGVTGGSPFYIRNRMREALRVQDESTPVRLWHEGTELSAERFHFRPFADDPNRERMGAFGDLEIQFVISADVPGNYVALSYRTGEIEPGVALLSESILLDGVEILE